VFYNVPMHSRLKSPRTLVETTGMFLAILVTAPCWGQAPNTARAHHPFKLSPTENSSCLRLGNLSQTRHWAPMSSWTEPKFSHGEDPDTWNLFTPHLRDSDGSDGDALLGSPLSYPMAPIRNTMDRLYKRNILVNIYDLLIFQNVSRTLKADENPNSLYNRFDVSMHVKTWDIPDQGAGIFTASFRVNNNVLGTDPPGQSVGAISPLNDVDSNTSFLINRLEFEQTFMEERVVLTFGKGNPNDTIASNLFAWDETSQFIAVTFDGGNYPIGYGGYMPLVSLQVIPVDGIYMTGTVTSGIGSAYEVFSTVDDGLYWCAGEVGAVVEIGEEKRQGRYSIALMNSNTGNDTFEYATRNSGNAMSIVLQQEIAESTAIWSQYLLCSSEIGPAQQELTFGLSIVNCFDRSNDGFGIGIGWTDPSSTAFPGWRQRFQLETYYRLQLTESWQLSPDFQFLSRPADPQSEERPIYAFALRLLTEF
jgi:hypothetical protein